MLADVEDPFEFVSSDDDAPVLGKKTPPSIKNAPPSLKTLHLKKKSPRIVISKNSDEINEMLDMKKAIEESKKTALQEERARRYANRVLQKTPVSSPSTSTSGLENDNNVSSFSKHHQRSAVPKENEEGKAVTRKKQTRLRKKTLSSNNSGPSRNNNGKNSSVKQIDIVSSSSRESSVTPTLTETPTKKDSPVTRDTDSSLTPTQASAKKDSPVLGDVDFLSSGNHLKSPTPTQTSQTHSNADTSLSSSNCLKLPTLTQTPTRKDTSNAGSSFSSGNRLKLNRKRLPNISKEPTIKLSRVDTEFVASAKKPKPDLQKVANGKSGVTCNNVNANSTTSNGYKSSEIDTSVLTASRNEKNSGNRKEVPKQLKIKERETTAKTPKGKGKKSLQDTSKCHLKKCPPLYAPHGTNPCDYSPVIVRFFEDFKRQLRMAQNQCVTFVPWSPPLTSSKKDWKADKDDDKSTTSKSSVPALPLTLTLPVNSTVKEQQKETRNKKKTVEVDSLWQWDYHGFDSDDQRLFYDSDPNIDPKTSQTMDSPDQTPPCPTTTVTISEHMENLSPLNKDISIDISSSNSNVSSVIQPSRRKRKLLGRRIIGSSDAMLTEDKQSSSRQSLTSSLPRGPVHHPALSSSSPNITDIDKDPEQPTTTKLHSKKGVIDLTELDEVAEVDSCGSPSLSQEKQVTCPVCQQQFGEAYIALHAANCELHVDSNKNTGRLLPSMSSPSSTSKLRQTTLTHKPLSTTTQRRRVIESDSDAEELIPPVKKRKTRKLLPDNSKKKPLVYANNDDAIDNSDIDVQHKQGTVHSTSVTTTTTTTAAAAAAAAASVTNSIFKSASLVEQAVEEIESYSSDEEPASSTTGSSLIDYKNQFSTNSVGKVSKELLTEDNNAFLLARKKKWLSAKKGRMGGKERQRMWKKFKSKGRGRK